MGHFLTASTIYLCLLSYLLAAGCWVTGYRGSGYRSLWTTGCVFLILHAICAFHFYLGWSHLAAVNLTAEQTEEMMGFSFGEGIWFSYLLIAVWVVDVVLLWRNNGAELRSSWWAWFTFAVHGYAFFILFNGTVVFEQGAVRWGGIVGSIWLARMAWRYRRQGIFGTSRTELSG